jgi:DNA polymerase III alpha subunit
LLADVDNDIAYERRVEVIELHRKKAPGSRTAKDFNLNTLSGKLCIKECGKIVGEFSEQEVNEVSNIFQKSLELLYLSRQQSIESEKFTDWSVENSRSF